MTKIEGAFYPLQEDEWLEAALALSHAELTILDLLRTQYPYGQEVDINCAEIARTLSTEKKTVRRRTASRALKKLNRLGFIELENYGLKNYNRVESQVRVGAASPEENRLHQQLSGLVEVTIPNGRIDLLTDPEIIEVKRIEDWKAALGQILVYSGFYREPHKRLHLFGSTKDEVQITDIALSCLPFDVRVTFEVVVSIKTRRFEND